MTRTDWPGNVTEEAFLAAVENAVRVLGSSYTFGIYDLDDIRQEAARECLLAMPSYDPSRPLENFLYTHVKNRLGNLKRNKLRRPGSDAPCQVCHRSAGSRSGHEGGEWCPRYVAWKARNDAKAGVMCARDLGVVEPRGREPGVEDEAGLNEALRLIDERLPADLRSAYLRMRAGQRVSPAKRAAVERVVREAIGGG